MYNYERIRERRQDDGTVWKWVEVHQAGKITNYDHYECKRRLDSAVRSMMR